MGIPNIHKPRGHRVGSRIVHENHVYHEIFQNVYTVIFLVLHVYKFHVDQNLIMS